MNKWQISDVPVTRSSSGKYSATFTSTSNFKKEVYKKIYSKQNYQMQQIIFLERSTLERQEDDIESLNQNFIELDA